MDASAAKSAQVSDVRSKLRTRPRISRVSTLRIRRKKGRNVNQREESARTNDHSARRAQNLSSNSDSRPSVAVWVSGRHRVVTYWKPPRASHLRRAQEGRKVFRGAAIKVQKHRWARWWMEHRRSHLCLTVSSSNAHRSRARKKWPSSSATWMVERPQRIRSCVSSREYYRFPWFSYTPFLCLLQPLWSRLTKKMLWTQR